MKAKTHENKMTAPVENKGRRVPTGEIDRAVYVRVIEGQIPTIDLRTFRRSPSELSEEAFLPTAAGVTIQAQYADELIEAIGRAGADAGHTVVD